MSSATSRFSKGRFGMFTMLRSMLLALVTVTAAIAPAGAQQAPDRVRLSLNPGSYAYLPIFLAADKGYFAAREHRQLRQRRTRVLRDHDVEVLRGEVAFVGR